MINLRRLPFLAAAALAALALLSLLGAQQASANDPLRKAEPGLVAAVRDNRSATFWVYLSEQADLSEAAGVRDHAAQGRLVYDQLTATAKRSQAGLRAMLDAEGVEYESFWIANTLKVTGDADLLERIAARPEVEQITSDRVYELTEPVQGQAENTIQGIEWGIDRINAPGVWSQFGVRGEGIVVGAIDSGALFTHPALVEQYRGNRHDGSFDHDYNWHDPDNGCGGQPCPFANDGRGTGAAGIMVGDDGAGNQIGVAPRAQWMMARAADGSTHDMLLSGQFMLAPTDINGEVSRPELRPHIVSVAWRGAPSADPWFRATVEAWTAAGIFPVFTAGADFPTCGRVINPANLPESYAAGAFDVDNEIWQFSPRGPSRFGSDVVKPNIAAPGVNVRSAWDDGGYLARSDTAYAAAHVAGAVALLWSLSPTLERDVAATRALLDGTAIDTSDISCGGTAENNNVFGEGRLDVLAAANQAPLTPSGRLEGTVTDADTGAPISGVIVRAAGPLARAVPTDANGDYSLPRLPVGSYEITASKFGYPTHTQSATIAEDQTTTVDIALAVAPRHPVSGHVRDTTGKPIANATVTIVDTPLPPATTSDTGAYSFPDVPAGSYDTKAARGGCYVAQTQQLLVSAPTTADFTLPQRSDAYGYTCLPETAEFAQGDTPLPLIGGGTWITIDLPWEFTFYGHTYTQAHICADGTIEFVGPPEARCSSANARIPSADPDNPNGAIYPFWDDLTVDTDQAWRGEFGTFPNRRFVIEWRDVHIFGGFGQPLRQVDFNVVLHENGEIETHYRNIASDDGRERGNSATLGLENADGTVAFQHSFHQPVLDSETSIHYFPPALAISDVSLAEGNAGSTAFEFTVTKSNTAGAGSVEFSTEDGSATEPGDYAAVSGTLEFAPGEATKTITIPVKGDRTVEADETFRVNLTSPTNATISDGEGQGTIENDDALPALAIGSINQAEGSLGATAFAFTVTKSTTHGPATVDFATSAGTASDPDDFVAANGTLSFAAGEGTKTITVLVNGDATVEADETFTVQLRSPTSATIADGEGLGTIQNDDSAALPPPPSPPPSLARPPAVRCVVPNVKGMTITRARRMLAARRCALGRTTPAYSAKVRRARIISQSRRPGARLRRGTRVNVVISRGRRPPVRR